VTAQLTDPQVAAAGGPRPAPRIRASDADRHATVQRVQDGIARGLLAFDEGSDRMAAAWAGRYLDDLTPLTADLPPATPTQAATAPGWPALGAPTRRQLRHSLRTTATAMPRFNRLTAVSSPSPRWWPRPSSPRCTASSRTHHGREGANPRGGLQGGGCGDDDFGGP
jgi:hypothetical protein